MPYRFQRSRQAGAKLREGAVCVTRGTPWGNPFVIGKPVDLGQATRWGWSLRDERLVCQSPEEAICRFAHCLFWDQAIHDHVRFELGGRDLACWCHLCAQHESRGLAFADRCSACAPCHVFPLMWIANSTRDQVNRIADAIDAGIMEAARRAMDA